MSLRKQALSGMLWSFSQQFGTQIISFTINIVLARILVPSDFGIIALFSVVTATALAIVDGGLTSSLIRTQNHNERDLSTVFWFNTIIASIVYCLIYFIAPFIAEFYKLEILTSVIRVYCLILIVNSFAAVQNVLFVKEMDFKTSFKIQMPSLIISGICGILFAYNGYGVWALVYYYLLQQIVSTIQYWFYSKWRPVFLFDKEKFNYHFNFGYKLSLSSLLDSFFTNLYTVVIGKYFLPLTLGYYNQADNLKQIPVANISSALTQVVFPLLSKLSHDNVKLKEVYRMIMKLIIFVLSPILLLSIIIATPLFRFVLTEKWLPSVPYFQVLAIAGILYPIHVYNLNILKVKGRTDLILKLQLIKKVLFVLVLIISVSFGMMGIVWGQVIYSVLALFINSYYTEKLLDYKISSQILDLLPAFMLSFAVMVVFYFVDNLFMNELTDIFRICLDTIGFGLLYLVGVHIFKFREISYLKNLIIK